MDDCRRIDRTDTTFQLRQFAGRHEIGLVEKDDVGKGTLFQRLMTVLQPLVDMAGVEHRHDRIEPGPSPNVLVDKEGPGDGRGIGEARGLDQDSIETALAFHQAVKDADQIPAHGTADATAVHLEQFLVDVEHGVVVNAGFAEPVDNHGVLLVVLLGQNAVQGGRPAGTETPGQNGNGDLVHGFPFPRRLKPFSHARRSLPGSQMPVESAVRDTTPYPVCRPVPSFPEVRCPAFRR